MLGSRFDLRFRATGEVVVDVEALARGVMGAERWPIGLEAADNEELLAYLLGEAVILEERYADVDGIEARPWLFQRLRFRARDWRIARSRRPGLPAVDDSDPWLSWGDDYGPPAARDFRAGIGDRPDPASVAGDRGDDWLDDCRRLLESGDRALLREVESLSLSPPPGARGRDTRADRALRRLERLRRARVAEVERRARELELALTGEAA